MRAFSGYLGSNQLLALWDRILAFDSLEILPGRRSSSIEREKERKWNLFRHVAVLAVSIFIFRKGNV